MAEDNGNFFELLRKISEDAVELPEIPSWNDNDDFDRIDDRLREASESTYLEIVQKIVDISSKQLEEQNQSKNELKATFSTFFICFIALQYLVLVFLLMARGICGDAFLSEGIIVTYITSVFVESLGGIIIMVKYAFDSDQEVNILKILNGVIANFQKFDKK